MNNITKEIIDEAKHKLSNEKRKHPEHFSNQNYERSRLEFYIKAASEKEIKERAQGYSSFLDKYFWEYIGNRALEISAELVIGLMVFYFPVGLVLAWFNVSSFYATYLISAFIGLVVLDVVFFDKTVESFKAGIHYGVHNGKKYQDAIEEVKRDHDTV